VIEILLVSQLILWVVVAGLAVTVLLLARQIGVLHERVAPVGALMTDAGAAVGDPAPVMEVRDIADRPLRIGGASPGGRDLLLLFVAPSCPVCKKLLPLAKRFARSEQRSLDILFVGDGEREEQERFVRAHGLAAFATSSPPWWACGCRWGVCPTPS
jgi:methylamine dehydrogenase accessory protein MauD